MIEWARSPLFDYAMDKQYQTLFENFALILSSLPCNLYWKDVNSVYMGCNNRLATTLGLSSPAAIIGKTDFDFGWDVDAAKSFIDFDQQVMKEKRALETLDTFTEADGRVVTVLTNKNPLFDEQGHVVGVLATSTDITELKETQAWLKQALEESQLAVKTHKTIFENIKHNWITAISDIEAPLDALVEMLEDDDLLELANYSLTGIKQLHEHASGILALVQSGEGIPAVTAKPMDLASVASNVKAMFVPSIYKKQINFILDTAGVPEIVRGDGYRIERIMIYLLSNAVKFTRENGDIWFTVQVLTGVVPIARRA